jgi:hypothetical protein
MGSKNKINPVRESLHGYSPQQLKFLIRLKLLPNADELTNIIHDLSNPSFNSKELIAKLSKLKEVNQQQFSDPNMK